MEERFCWRCDTEVKMLDDNEFKLCRDAWFEGKEVVEKELEKEILKILSGWIKSKLLNSIVIYLKCTAY